MTEAFYNRYIFLCESGDGWWLFAEPVLEAPFWEGVTDPALLALREEGRRLWYVDPEKHKGGAFANYDDLLASFRRRAAEAMNGRSAG